MSENKKRRGLFGRPQQSAGQRAEEPRQEQQHTPRPKKKGRAGKIIGTIVLVGVLTMAIFVGIFMTYINKSLKGHVEVDMSEYDRKVSTELYRLGTDGETWEMYQTLFSDENRIWVDIGDIPKYLQEAIITIRSDRYVVPVKSEHKNAIPGLVHDVSSSGSTFFIEPMGVVKANNELRELAAREKKETEALFEVGAEETGPEEAVVRSTEAFPPADVELPEGAGARFPVVVSIRSASSL